MTRRFGPFAALAWSSAVLLATAVAPAADEAYTARRIHTVAGDPIDDGVLWIRDGKVVAVGRRSEVQLPPDCQVHEATERVIVPGFVVAQSTLADAGRDEEKALTPQVRAYDGFDFYRDYRDRMGGGAVTVQLSPGSQRLIPGQGGVVKLAGRDADTRSLLEVESLRILLTQRAFNPPTLYEPPVGAVSVERPVEVTRAQLSQTLAGAVAGLRALLRSAGSEEAGPPASADRAALAAIKPVLARGRTVQVTARTPAEIRGALSLAEEFDLSLVIVDPQDAQELAGALEIPGRIKGVILNVGVRAGQIVDTPRPDPSSPPPPPAWEVAGELVRLGAADRLAIVPADDSDLEQIDFLASLFLRGGLTPAEVLRMVTLNPARMLEVAHRVGSLESGKDADFVVLNGDPFEPGTRVAQSFVDGTLYFDRAAERKVQVVRASAVYTGSDVVQNGMIVVSGSRLRGVGASVSAPADAEIRAFPGAVIVPGFVDMGATLGFGAPLADRISLETKLADWIAADDPAAPAVRAAGVTTVLAGSGQRPTPIVAFKLGRSPRVLKDPVGLGFEIRGNLTSVESELRSTLTAGREYADSWAKYARDMEDYKRKLAEYEASQPLAAPGAASPGPPGGAGSSPPGAPAAPAPGAAPATQGASSGGSQPAGSAGAAPATQGTAPPANPTPAAPAKPQEPAAPRAVPAMEPYRELFAGRIIAFVQADSDKAVGLALKLFRTEFAVPLVLAGGPGVDRQASTIAEGNVAMAVGPSTVIREDGGTVNLPQVLSNAGIPFGFQSRAAAGAAQLPLAVQYAVHEGLGLSDALAGLTTSPAKFLKLSSVGELSAGRDADLVVLSGPPFEPASEVLAVMIDGEWVYEKEARE
jgi:imidazolonepropionase-like amidohydrolase